MCVSVLMRFPRWLFMSAVALGALSLGFWMMKVILVIF